MTKQSLTKVSAAHQVKIAFRAIRDELTQSNQISLQQFIEVAQANHPELNSADGYSHIRNVFYGRAADYNLTKTIENYRNSLIQ